MTGHRCSQCGEPVGDNDYDLGGRWGTRKIYLCRSSECGIQHDRDQRDAEREEYEAAIDAVNSEFGRGGPRW